MRRRRHHPRAKPLKRERPVMIECHGAPKLDPVVQIGNETYEFADDGHGRKVAMVFVEDHIACFLARPEMYRACT